MTDLHARLAEALAEVINGDDPWGCDDLADVLLSLDGIAIVELPDTFDRPGVSPFQHRPPSEMRAIAAALLTAANAAADKNK
jgi:hypothetical protein